MCLCKKELNNIKGSIDELRKAIERAFHLHPTAHHILIYGGNNMGLIVTAGAAALLVQLIPLPSGSVFDSPADLALTADDPAAVVVPAPGDATGTLFAVSVPASDTNTSLNLKATGVAGGISISGTAPVQILPAGPPPPEPATSIGIVAAPSSGAAAAPAVGNARAAVKK